MGKILNNIKSSLMSNKHEKYSSLLVLGHYMLKPQLNITITTIVVQIKKTKKVKCW